MSYRGLPATGGSPADVARLANLLLLGKLNATKEITLDASVGSTDFADPRFTASSWIGFMPLTANAATEFGAGTLRVSAQGTGTMTVTHANNANADKTFRILIIG